MRNQILYTLGGLMVGFVAGYLLHDVMASRQPPKVPAGAGVHAEGADPASPMAQIDQLRRYVAENPRDADAVRLLANLNFEIRNWERARELYADYLELRPGDVDVMTDLGVAYRELGQHDRALETFSEVRALDPSHWPSRYNEIIVLAFDLGRMEAARAALAELQELEPDNPSVARLAAELERRG